MLNFAAHAAQEISFDQLITGLCPQDLRCLTNEMVDAMLVMISASTDADVTFQPLDPFANDPYASDSDEVAMSWTLAHVILHTTASAEEAAALAAELARGYLLKKSGQGMEFQPGTITCASEQEY